MTGAAAIQLRAREFCRRAICRTIDPMPNVGTHRRAAEGYAIRKEVPGAPPRSLGVEPLSDAELAEVEAELEAAAQVGLVRPKSLSQCPSEKLPCPFATCRHSLLSFRSSAGPHKEVWPDRDLMSIDPVETCSLRVAARAHRQAWDTEFQRTAAMTYGEIARVSNCSLERAMRIGEGAIEKLRASPDALEILSEFVSARGGSR